MPCEYCLRGGGKHESECPNYEPEIYCDQCGHKIAEFEEYQTTANGTIICQFCRSDITEGEDE